MSVFVFDMTKYVLNMKPILTSFGIIRLHGSNNSGKQTEAETHSQILKEGHQAENIC